MMMAAKQKLTDEQRNEIRSRHAAGGTRHCQLAAEFGVSPTSISRIVNPEARANQRRWYAENADRRREYSSKARQKRMWGSDAGQRP
jgi:hypothetical protein